MKKDKTSLDIVNIFALVLATGVLVAAKLYKDIDWLAFFAFLLAISFLFHYFIEKKIAYNEANKINKPLLKVSSVVAIMVFICLPILMFFVEKNEDRKIAQHLEQLQQPIDLGTDTTLYDMTCTLKTRFSDNNIEYIFKAEYTGENHPNVSEFEINLLDSDGFKIDVIRIKNSVCLIDSKTDEYLGFSKNSKSIFYDYKDYERIASFDVCVTVVE